MSNDDNLSMLSSAVQIAKDAIAKLPEGVDRTQLHSQINNIIRNAREASPEPAIKAMLMMNDEDE